MMLFMVNLMRTTLTIDDTVLNQVLQSTGRSNPLDAIRDALQSYLQQEKLKQVIALRGKVLMDDNWRALRQLDTPPESRPA
jgi:metal-responsive CopG/Arc/MetJ family transcriptional regulator